MAGSPDPERGRRILPAVLDDLAKKTPNRVYASVLRSNDVSEGFREVTVSEVSRATDAVASWFHNTIGLSKRFETLAYVGVNDLRYPMLWFAAIKCGFKVLLLSPRNTLPQNVSLMTQTSCTKLFYTDPLESLAQSLADALKPECELHICSVAPFDTWVASYAEPYPYRKTFEKAEDDPIIVLHSSGSTGDPKPITNTNGFFAAADRALPTVENHELGGISLLDYEGGGGYYSPFPGFHIAGITALAFYPVMMRSASVILGLADRPPSIDMVHTILLQKRPRVLYLPPSIIEALSQIPSALDTMKHAESVVFAGGPLSKPVGDMLSHHVKLSSSYGSTEMGNIPCLLPRDRADWAWLTWHPALKIDMEPSVEDAYELVLNRSEAADRWRGISNTILKHQAQFRSRDLFTPHPAKDGMWQFYSRNDDILVLSNGEKWNPIPSEGIIQSHPKLAGAFIIGDGEFQPAVLLEPKEECADSDALIGEVWPLIAQANAHAQRFGRVTRTKVAVVPPTSFSRAPKGTIVRRLTLQKLNHLKRQLYGSDGNHSTITAEHSNTKQGEVTPDMAIDREEDVVELVRHCVREVSPLPEISDGEDLFVNGFDSLETLELARLLKHRLSLSNLNKQASFVSPQFVYTHPTIELLAKGIYETLHGNIKEACGAHDEVQQHVKYLVSKHTKSLTPNAQPAAGNLTENDLHVVLTGSTGSLGRELLLSFASCNRVQKITCLDRSMTTARSKALGLFASAANPHLKVSFLQAELEKPDFGLSTGDRGSFCDADVFVHNAWKVDFNQSLSSFEPLIAGVSNIARWATKEAQKSARVVFVSSIAAASEFHGAQVPEEFFDDPSVAAPSGYGQSKYVAEHVLAKAAKETGLDVTVLRIGQIAGSLRQHDVGLSSSTWKRNEWLPSLIRTSKTLGKLPAELPMPVDWLPSNVVADACVEIMQADIDVRSAATLTCYNLVNPANTEWSPLAEHVQRSLESSSEQRVEKPADLGLVTYSEWLDEVRAVGDQLSTFGGRSKQQDKLIDDVPALKMLPFFEGIGRRASADAGSPRYDTSLSARSSESLRKLGPIQNEWMRKWISEWRL